LRFEYWGRHPSATACAGQVPLNLFLAPILLAAEPAGRPLAATLTVLGPLVVAFGMVRGCAGLVDCSGGRLGSYLRSLRTC
jgi:hypothetical protein